MPFLVRVLVVDSNAEPAFAGTAQRLEPIAAKRPEVFRRSRGVEPDQARSGLLFNVHQPNHAQSAQQLPGPIVFERLDHICKNITFPIILQEAAWRRWRRLPQPPKLKDRAATTEDSFRVCLNQVSSEAYREFP